jgi:hypothetical protein
MRHATPRDDAPHFGDIASKGVGIAGKRVNSATRAGSRRSVETRSSGFRLRRTAPTPLVDAVHADLRTARTTETSGASKRSYDHLAVIDRLELGVRVQTLWPKLATDAARFHPAEWSGEVG